MKRAKLVFRVAGGGGLCVEPEPFFSNSFSSYSTVKHVIFTGTWGNLINFDCIFVSLRTVM